jgi:maltodextrin utilization protein YvdJ
MLPVVAALLEQGLTILGGAVMSKGKEVVEEKLEIKLPNTTLSAQEVVELKKLEFQHEEWLINAGLQERAQELEFQKLQEGNITDRWKADMTSDSWLSKNIRPSVLLYLLTAYTLLALMSAFGLNVSEAYVTLLGQWGMVVMTAYFGGRTLEKIKLGGKV